jgi:plasmid stability protein
MVDAESEGTIQMSESIVTLTLPTAAYDELQQRAQQHHRHVEEEATLTLLAALSAGETLPPDTATALDALSLLDDEALERVSHSQPTVEDGILLDALVDKRRRQPLGPNEEQLLAELIDRHDRVMALRAEAIALLAQRGVDVKERVARA